MTAVFKALEESLGQPLVDEETLPEEGYQVDGNGCWVRVFARAKLPTRFGDFNVIVFKNSVDNKEHLAIVRGVVQGGEAVPMRVHSECLTGDVFGSLRCDCRDQLEFTLRSLGQQECGVLVYLRQEGRGIGLGNKIRAYSLQEKGFDTYEANQHLGFDDDLRDYRIAALIVQALKIESVGLVTNNPKKISGLEENGIKVVDRVPVVMDVNPHNKGYLRTKAKKSGHLLPF